MIARMAIKNELVGRAAETDMINGLLRRVLERGATLLVHGEPGIGKSALLSAAADHARRRGMRVLTTAGVQSEARLPFAGLHRLLKPVLSELDELPAAQRETIQAAFGQTDVDDPGIFRIALATLDLLSTAAARAPILAIAEDSHWLDRSTIDVLSFVARRVESEPVILLAALRDGFEHIPLELGLPALQLKGLDDDASRTLLEARAPGLDDKLRERVLETAAGNALALVELPIAWRDAEAGAVESGLLPLTARLEYAFVARTSEMAPETRTLLLVASVDEEGLVSEVLDATASILGDSAETASFDPPIAAGLVSLDDMHVRFRHPLVRSAIYQAASAAERHAAHAALSEVLIEQPDRRAWHRAASAVAPDAAVAAELISAADRAQQRGGASVAMAALERAAHFSKEPGERDEVLLRAAELCFELGRQDTFDRLLKQVEPSTIGPVHLGQLSWLRGLFDEGLGGGASRIAPMVMKAEEVAREGEADLALKLLWSAALQCWFSDPDEGTRGRIVTLVDKIPGDDDDPRRLAIWAFAAPAERGADVMAQLPRLASIAQHDAGAARVVGTAATAIGAFEAAERLLATSAIGLRSQGRLGLLARTLTLQAWSAAHRVDLGVAIPVAEEAERLARETAQPLIVAVAQATQALLAGLRGDDTRAESLSTEAEQVAIPINAHAVLAAVQHARGVAALAVGRYAEAYDYLVRLHEGDDPSYHYFMRTFSVGDLAEAAVRSDQADAVTPIIAEMEAIAERTPSPLLHAGLAYGRTLLASDAAAEPTFIAAMEPTAAWPFLRARTQLAQGMWLRRRRLASASRAPLRAARDTFEALGTTPWADRARGELRASGETSRRRTADARDELSPQELQIATMAGEGLTNREIGQRLFLSHRTVSSHLYRIFPKLGITSRAELGAALAGAGPSA
jgi:DNA-binding CsgD family transcriptional regulator